MNTEKEALSADLKKYVADVDAMNKQLQDLDTQRQQILRVGTRLEGVIAYLRDKISAIEVWEKDNIVVDRDGTAAAVETPAV